LHLAGVQQTMTDRLTRYPHQGELVTNLMGEAAQQSFSRGWGVGLAISQATQFKDMFIVACQSALVLTVLETLWLVGNTPWVAEMIGALRQSCRLDHHTRRCAVIFRQFSRTLRRLAPCPAAVFVPAAPLGTHRL
jgi:hypothetical protein